MYKSELFWQLWSVQEVVLFFILNTVCMSQVLAVVILICAPGFTLFITVSQIGVWINWWLGSFSLAVGLVQVLNKIENGIEKRILRCQSCTWGFKILPIQVLKVTCLFVLSLRLEVCQNSLFQRGAKWWQSY